MKRSALLLALTASALAQNAAPGTTAFVQGDPARFTYTNMLTPLSLPCDVSEGPDNNIYVQELIGKIAQYNYKTGALKEFDIPFTSPLFPNATLPVALPDQAKAVFLSCAIRNGFDGKMYFSNGNRNQLVQFDVTTEQIKVFTPPGLLQPIGNAQPFNDITTAPDGVYFTQTTMNTIAKFDYTTHEISYINVPTLLSDPLGIYYANDGAIWFVETVSQKVGRLNRSTQTITEYPIPLPLGAGPIVMRAETQAPNGDYLLWFATIVGSSLCSINQKSKQILCYLENAGSTAQQVAQDHANNIWISHTTQNTLGVFNPRYGNFTEVVMPGTIAATPVSVVAYGGTGIFGKPVGDPFAKGTGDVVWFTQLAANRLVRYELEGLRY